MSNCSGSMTPNSRSTSSSSSSSPIQTPSKNVEDVWKYISLNSQDLPSSPNISSAHQGHHNKFPTSHYAILQNFLAGPLMKDSPTNPMHALNFQHPHTSLSSSHQQALMNISSNGLPALNRNDLSEAFTTGNGNGNESKKRRLMKNRESAARSRARKQAYTNELENEVAQLHKENRKLKKQYAELRKEMDAQAPVVTKAKLQRTLTAPF